MKKSADDNRGNKLELYRRYLLIMNGEARKFTVCAGGADALQGNRFSVHSDAGHMSTTTYISLWEELKLSTAAWLETSTLP
jgi:hypothetical protein